MTIRNNTVFARSPNKITGISLGGEGNGHVSVSNAVYSLGTGELVCFAYDLPKSSYAVRNNNLCWATNGAHWTTPYPSLSAFQAATGADLASYSADPLFTSTSEPVNFTPRAGSPLIDHGNAGSTSDDINGKARGSAPDIGAVER
jgi:hypothetical protein